MWTILPDLFFSLVYPQDCHVCRNEVDRREYGVACSDCWDTTRIFKGTEMLCDKCGAFLFEVASASPSLCGKCHDHSYDMARSLGIYHAALSASVLRLKRVPQVAPKLKQLFISAFEAMALDPDVVVPVPLSARRLQERGFNQAAVLGKLVARRCGILLDQTSLIRAVHTPMHRAGMDRKARASTVKNAFRVTRPKLIEGRHVLLIDDVLTSGETVSVCADALKRAGAVTVSVLTAARAEKIYS